MRRILTISVLALMFLSLGPPARAETFHFSFKGLFAEAFFDRVDGCVETFVDVFAEDGRVSGPGHPSAASDAAVFIGQFDVCTNTELLSAFGSTILSAEEFQIDRTLSSASLATTITVEDFVSGNSFPVDVDVNWTGTGATFREIDNFHIISHDFKVAFHLNGLFRDATASGTVSDGVTNFTPEPAVFAIVGNVKVGEVDIVH